MKTNMDGTGAGTRQELPAAEADGRREVLPPAAFRSLVHRERARADRNSHGFVIAAFEVGGNGDRPHRARLLTEALHRRCRFTDDIGWMDGGRIGVLMPDTAAEGAQVLIGHVHRELFELNLVPACRLHVHPDSDEVPPGEENDDSEPGAPLRESGRMEAAPGGTAPAAAIEHGIEAIVETPYPAWKRGLDMAGAAVGMLVFAPVMAGLIALVKMVSPGPAFFRQTRIGAMGKPFTCWKLRTMRVDCDSGCHREHVNGIIHSDQPLTKLDIGNDSRVIPFGTIIRQSGLDELPQLFNVLRGDMSLVGPRPCIPYEYQQFRRWQRTRVDARPGLTGLWQVSGKNRTTFAEMMRLDIRYVRSLSLTSDLRILFKTASAIIDQVRAGRGDRPERNREDPETSLPVS